MELKQIRVLVIDDEEASMRESVQKMELYLQPENIYRVFNAVEMMRILQTTPIDIAFVDVEMPDTDGFSVAEYIHRTQPKLKVVFLTGHTELGAKSYDYEPMDFLTKPVDAIRLQKTFDRYLALQGGLRQAKQRIAVETTTGFALISPMDIIYIAREDRKAVIHCKKERYALKYSLDELEALFSDFDLFRCHQSYLIPLHQVTRVIQADFGKTYFASLMSGDKIPVSRNRFDALKKVLAGRGIQFV